MCSALAALFLQQIIGDDAVINRADSCPSAMISTSSLTRFSEASNPVDEPALFSIHHHELAVPAPKPTAGKPARVISAPKYDLT
jgi:hypothetical protein